MNVDSAVGGQTQADLAKPVKQGLIPFFEASSVVVTGHGAYHFSLFNGSRKGDHEMDRGVITSPNTYYLPDIKLSSLSRLACLLLIETQD